MFGTTPYRINSWLGKCAAAVSVFALFAAGSCVKIDQEVSPVVPTGKVDDEWTELSGRKLPMRFVSSVKSVDTKAGGTSPLPANGTFGVFAFLQEGDIASHDVAEWSDGGWYPSYMYNQKVTFDGTSEYDYSPIKYWPNNAENTISFWAYSPHNATVGLFAQGTETAYTNTTVGIPDVQFSVTTGKEDFMTADFVKDKTYVNCTPEKGRVDFQFHHRLAQIQFKARTADDYSSLDQTIKITEVELVNQYNSGILNHNPETNAAAWTRIYAESTSGLTAFSGEKSLAYAASNCGSELYMIPQNIRHNGTGESGNQVSARVRYSLRVNNVEIPHEVVVSLYNEDVKSWEANKCYSYTLIISATDGLSVKATVMPWEYWLGTGDYEENVTVTKQLEWETGTYDAITTGNFKVNNLEEEYAVVVLKPNTVLSATFSFDTPYHGTWVAMLEPVGGSDFESVVFENGQIQTDGMVGGDLTIGIKAGSGTYSHNQYALLRFMCRTEAGQTLAVKEGTLGGPYVIALFVN